MLLLCNLIYDDDNDDDDDDDDELALMKINRQLLADSSSVSPYLLCFDGYATKYISCCQLEVN